MVNRLIHPTHSNPCIRWSTALTAVVVTEALVIVSRSFRRVSVTGDSMVPALRDGDRLLVGPRLGVQPGAIVAIRDPRSSGRLLVKRVHGRGPDWVDVRGDNDRGSTDSRHFGPLPLGLVVGRIVYRYGPPGRTGWFPGRPGQAAKVGAGEIRPRRAGSRRARSPPVAPPSPLT
jgi:nickel-type superoxide dismutase maturation protease